MASSSNWLATLLRIRKHRHDTALQSLAQSLSVARAIHDRATDVEAKLSQLGLAQKQTSQSGQLDSERLRQFRQDRDLLRGHRNDLRNQQTSADAAVRQAQSEAAEKDAETEVLRRLRDQLHSAYLQVQRRRDEQTLLENTVSLCKGQISG